MTVTIDQREKGGATRIVGRKRELTFLVEFFLGNSMVMGDQLDEGVFTSY